MAHLSTREPFTADAAIDGLYVIRNSLPPSQSDDSETVGADKRLARTERAFRSLKPVDLKVRPIHLGSPDRVGKHVILYILPHGSRVRGRIQLRLLDLMGNIHACIRSGSGYDSM